MATTAWVEFTSAATSTPGNTNWTNAANALTINTDYAYATLADGDISYFLKATNPGTGLDEVIGKQIDGVEVEVRGTGQDSAGQELEDLNIKLIIGGAIVGDNKAIGTQWTDASMVIRVYGGAADLWGLTPDDTDIASSTFGATVQFESIGGSSAQMRVATVRVRITYSDAGSTCTATGNVAALTAAASAGIENPSTATGTVAALTADADAAITNLSTATGSLAALTTAASGKVSNSSTATGSLAALTVSAAAAQSLDCEVAVTLAALTIAGTEGNSTGWLSPSVAATSGTGDAAWRNADNAKTHGNGDYADTTSDVPIEGDTDFLVLTNFAPSFDPSEGPVGILVEIVNNVADVNDANIEDLTVQLMLDGSPIGDNKAMAEHWGGPATVIYGDREDLWGLASLSAADAADATFGVRIQATNALPAGDVTRPRVFSVRMLFFVGEAAATGSASVELGALTVAANATVGKQVTVSLELAPLTAKAVIDTDFCECCIGYTLMNLLEIRNRFVKDSGHYELVTDAAAGDWSDNGADDHIRAGARFCDDQFQYNKSEAWFYAPLAAGGSRVTFRNARIIKQVWLAAASGERTLLKRTDLTELRELYSKAELSAETTGTPLYWSPAIIGLAPEQVAETSGDFAGDGMTDYDIIYFGEHYPHKAIYVMPPADGAYTLQVKCEFYSLELCEDEDVSFWSQYPEILLLAARRDLEIHKHRNTTGAQDFERPLLMALQKLYHNLIAEESAGPTKVRNG